MASNSLPPDLQALLEQLFELFSLYAESSDPEEQTQLHAQIVYLFSRMGVAGDSPAIRQAERMFEILEGRALGPPLRRPSAPRIAPPLATEAREFMRRRVQSLERTNDLKLTAGARQLIRLPVVEVAEFAERFDREEVTNSLQKLFDSLQERPSSALEGRGQRRTSVAVIRAFWKNFCKIPPFCSGDSK